MKSRAAGAIEEVFAGTRSAGRAALMPYLTLGFPTLEVSLRLIEAAVANGADMVELGVPFSDPLADGPVIQHATHVALQRGITLPKCLDAVRRLRQRGIAVPLMLMGYFNPISAFGEAAFAQACADAGVDGLIVPDLPPDEAAALEGLCASHAVGLTYLLAPTSSPQRMRLVTGRSRGFVYLVSVAGVTGARDSLPPLLAHFVQRVRAVTRKPLAVGFGISTPAQAREVASIADGVIVGSAIVKLARTSDGVARVGQFVSDLKRAVSHAPAVKS
jgi:tryptophan synthase alpha chain